MESRESEQERRERQLDDEPLREEDVTAADRLDDRVQEGDGLRNDLDRPVS